MNQLSEEEKIRQLFHESREEDRQRAPSFANTLEAARSKPIADKPRPLLWQAAAMAASIIIIIGIILMIRYSASESVSPAPAGESIARSPEQKIEPTPSDGIKPAPIIKPVAHGKIARRKSRPAQLDSRLISRWQSPTDFLLKTSGSDLFKSVPRISNSTINLKTMPEKN